MTMRLPLVSVIIPYYAQSAFIEKTVLSVKKQTYPNIELIVVDDGSPIPAAPSLVGISDITLIETKNAGCPAARNVGFEICSGEYLVFLDGDDLLEPDAVEINLKVLLNHPEAVMSFGAVRVIDQEGQELVPASVCRARRNYFSMLLETNPIPSCGAAMVRRSAFIQAGLFRELSKFQVDDYEFYIQLARVGAFAQHGSCILEYRRHGGNMSNSRKKMLLATLEVLDRVETEQPLTVFQRLQLSHGRSRWIYEYRDKNEPSSRWRDLYFRWATAWNLDLNQLAREIYDSTKQKCGWKPTHSYAESSIVSSGIRHTECMRNHR